VREAIESILAKNETLTLFQIHRALVINGQKVEVSGRHRTLVQNSD
jgi:hypothetical protein